MDEETKARIETTVREILEESDMTETTEYKVRKLASEKLSLNLSDPSCKALVRQVVNSFLDEQKAKQALEEEEDAKGDTTTKEFNDDGDLIICRLTDKRKVTIQEFKGKPLVSIREYYKKDGKELPSAKGISLNVDQWSAVRKNISAIENAIKEMESRL